MYILGISCYYHDSAAVLIKDGEIIAASDEERFSRIKHDSSFPKLAVDFCLRSAKISSKDLSYVVFYEKPFLKFERIFLTSLRNAPRSGKFFRESMKEWFLDKIWIKSHIISNLNIDPRKLLFSEHHLSHMASAYFVSPYQKSAVLSIDAVGEWTTTAWGIANENDIEIKEEIRFPNSLGLLYSAFTVFCGFEPNEGEYKLMGLAPYGKAIYKDKIYKLINLLPDGSYGLHMKYFSYEYDLQGIYTKEFLKIFGKPNRSSEKVIKYYADIAASIQEVTEEILVKIATYVRKESGLSNLCYAGGVAYNSKANWQILNNSGFRNIFIQPAAGDSGGAMGAALWVYHSVLKNKKRQKFDSVYLGFSEERDEIKKVLQEENIKYKEITNEKLLTEEISEKIVKEKVVGWVQGRTEWGPRALGARSIIASPKSEKMKETVNKKIKFREGFRPFAPSVIQENAKKYFDVADSTLDPFKFMLYVVPVVEGQRGNLGAITHVDGTARPQFVFKEISPLYHGLISAVGRKSKTPVVLNTSFNLRGEPIVNSAKNALRTFYKSGIDTLVLGNFKIEK
jgi:carbamoyltransferase